MNPYSKVMVALDQLDPRAAYRLVEELGDKIGWYKIGSVLYTRAGHELIEFLHGKNKRIFLDLKLHDIPTVVGKTVSEIGALGVDFLTVHCLGGKAMLQEAAHSCRNSKLKLLGITLLTSHEKDDSAELGWSLSEEGSVMALMRWALEARLSGIVCSPNELISARKLVLPGFLLVTPGIRLEGQTVYQDDQKRVATPSEALARGADYLVIGRPITDAREPKAVVDALFAERSL